MTTEHQVHAWVAEALVWGREQDENATEDGALRLVAAILASEKLTPPLDRVSAD